MAIGALLPLINPVGSALIFGDLVGDEPVAVYRYIAGRVSVATFLFLCSVEYLGSFVLRFFGIAVPVVQVAGGLVLAATGWRLLFQHDANAEIERSHRQIALDEIPREDAKFKTKTFYPFTFPVTAGPGVFVAMLTLSIRASASDLPSRVQAHTGIAAASLFLCAAVFVCYSYAPRLISVVSPSGAHGFLRIIAFLLTCIGVQLVFHGLKALPLSSLFNV